jgi:hypothetical protein
MATMFFTVFYSFLCDTYTHLIFLCALLNVFCAYSPSPRLLSHTLIVSRFLQQVSRRIQKGDYTDYLYILDKGKFDAEIDPFSFLKEKSGRFSNLFGIALL